MKNFILTLFVFISANALAQNEHFEPDMSVGGSIILAPSTGGTISFVGSEATLSNPPKIRVINGFLSNRYEIGDKTTPAKQVALHLKEHNIDSYVLWKNADRADKVALFWSVIGLVGTIVATTAEKDNTKLIGYSTTAFGFGACGVCLLIGDSRRQRAIDKYNNKFGY